MELSALPKDLQRVIKALTQKKELECVVLYGSFARGQPHKESDFDLAIAAIKPISLDLYWTLLSEISALTDKKIDLADMQKAHPPFLQEILRQGVWFKKNSDVYYHILKRCLFETEDFLPLRKGILEKKIKRFIGDL